MQPALKKKKEVFFATCFATCFFATCFEKKKKPLVWGQETQAPSDSATGHIQLHTDAYSSARWILSKTLQVNKFAKKKKNTEQYASLFVFL